MKNETTITHEEAEAIHIINEKLDRVIKLLECLIKILQK